jgi:hypothetical protein
MEVIKIEQSLLLPNSPHNEQGNGNQFAPGYGGKGRGRYAEDNLDDEEEEEEF